MLGVCLIAPFCPSLVFAQQPAAASAPPGRPPKKTFTIVPAGSPVVIDGDLGEAAWSNATEIPLIYEWQPGDNVPPAADTMCLVTFDAENLYIAFMASASRGRMRMN